MSNDDMHRFIAVLMRYGIIFALMAAALLAGIAALLIWKPVLLLEILRHGIAAACIISAVWIVLSLIRGVLFGSNKHR